MIQGRVSDAGGAKAALERWVNDLAPGATGWLGSTAGVTEDLAHALSRSTSVSMAGGTVGYGLEGGSADQKKSCRRHAVEAIVSATVAMSERRFVAWLSSAR